MSRLWMTFLPCPVRMCGRSRRGKSLKALLVGAGPIRWRVDRLQGLHDVRVWYSLEGAKVRTVVGGDVLSVQR